MGNDAHQKLCCPMKLINVSIKVKVDISNIVEEVLIDNGPRKELMQRSTQPVIIYTQFPFCCDTTMVEIVNNTSIMKVFKSTPILTNSTIVI